MTRPKIRTFIAILAAAVAVAAVLAPVASAGLVPTTGPTGNVVTQGPTGSTDTIARVNDGRFKTSLEAKKIKAANCANMQVLWDAAKEDADYYGWMGDLAWQKGYTADANHYWSLQLQAIDTMSRVLDDMRAMGC
jgi:hypothetical protein